MTEIQGWLGIALLVVSLASVVWSISSGFATIRAELHSLAERVLEGFQRNDRDHDRIERTVAGHAEDIADHTKEIAGLKRETG